MSIKTSLNKQSLFLRMRNLFHGGEFSHWMQDKEMPMAAMKEYDEALEYFDEVTQEAFAKEPPKPYEFVLTNHTLGALSFLTVDELLNAVSFIRCAKHLSSPKDDILYTLLRTIVLPHWDRLKNNWIPATTPEELTEYIYHTVEGAFEND